MSPPSVEEEALVRVGQIQPVLSAPLRLFPPCDSVEGAKWISPLMNQQGPDQAIPFVNPVFPTISIISLYHLFFDFLPFSDMGFFPFHLSPLPLCPTGIASNTLFSSPDFQSIVFKLEERLGTTENPDLFKSLLKSSFPLVNNKDQLRFTTSHSF